MQAAETSIARGVRQRVTRFRYATPWPWRLPDRCCGSAISAAAARYTECCSIIRESTAWRSGTHFGSSLTGVVVLRRGDLDAGPPLLRTGADEIAEPNSSLWFLTGLIELAEALGHRRAGRRGRCNGRSGDRASPEGAGYTPELLRLKGELLLLQGT